MTNNRNKTITIVALIVGIFAISIGFAAFSNILTISSEATVTPDSGSFRVVFSNINNGINENPVVPNSTNTTSGLVTTNGTINNQTSPTLTGMSATFTEPGQKVEYDLFVYNAGAYVANLNSVTFKGTKSCTPGSGTTASYVSSACNSINMTVKVGNDTYSTTTQNITGHSLSVGGYEPVKVTIEYASNGTRADGAFTVSFQDISLYYVTVSGVNENYQAPTPIEPEDTYAYLWYSGSNVDGPSIGGDASSLSTTLPNNQNYYLKYKLDNQNKVTNSYACAIFDGQEYCVEGGSSNYYGWDTNAANSTGNVGILYNIHYSNISGVICGFYSTSSSCDGGSVHLTANSNGYVSAIGSDRICYVNNVGSSNCGASGGSN